MLLQQLGLGACRRQLLLRLCKLLLELRGRKGTAAPGRDRGEVSVCPCLAVEE